MQGKLNNYIILINKRTVVDSRGINDAFRYYNEKLHDSQENFNVNDLNQFLNKLNIPVISNDYRTDLRIGVNKEEIGHAV